MSSRTHPTVAVLMGGPSAEREVSLSSGRACADALRDYGYDRVIEVDAGPDLCAVLTDLKPDAVLNCLHGRWGEDGCVQGLLEWMRIPYSHSGVLASAVAMDKQRTKDIFRAAHLPVVESLIVPAEQVRGGHVMSAPYVVKPNNEGSSVGVYLVREADDGPPQLDKDMPEMVMVEAYAPGRELTTSVVGDRALTVTDIITTGWYDYDAKYKPGGSTHVVPAQIPAEIFDLCMDYALRAHHALGCRGVSRTDFRWDEARGAAGLVLLETNTQPGMTATSLTPGAGGGHRHGLSRLVSLDGGGCLMRALRRKAPDAGRTDPAPSRWAWRMQRLMLTPGIRLALRAGVPFCITLLAGTWYLADEGRRGAIEQAVAETRAGIEQRPEFMVNLMAVDGAKDELALYVREILPLDFPISSFDLDLDAMRATVTQISAVKSASVRIRPGGVLQIDIVERQAVALWRNEDGIALVDESGIYVAAATSRYARPDLPLIAGQGANAHVREALELIEAAAPLGPRLRGLVRMGERRWDVVLDRDQRILLPAEQPLRALERVIALEGRTGHPEPRRGAGRHAAGTPSNSANDNRGRRATDGPAGSFWGK